MCAPRYAEQLVRDDILRRASPASIRLAMTSVLLLRMSDMPDTDMEMIRERVESARRDARKPPASGAMSIE